MASSSSNSSILPSLADKDDGNVGQIPPPSKLQILQEELRKQRNENTGLHMLLEKTEKEKASLQLAQERYIQQKNIDKSELDKLRSELQQLKSSLDKKNEDNQNLGAKFKLEPDNERQVLINEKLRLNNQINRLSDERDELLEKFSKEREDAAMYTAKLVSAIKTIATYSAFVEMEMGDNISDGDLDHLQEHIQNQLKGNYEEKEELERKRGIINSIYKTLQEEHQKTQEGNGQPTVSSTSTDQQKNWDQLYTDPPPPQTATSSTTATREQSQELSTPLLINPVENSTPHVNPTSSGILNTSKYAICTQGQLSQLKQSDKLNTANPDDCVTVTAVTAEEPPRHSIPERKLGFKGKQLTNVPVTSKPHGISAIKSEFRCLCGIGPFASRQNLLVHIAKMTKEWKHQCKICKYFFFYPADLRAHNRKTCQKSDKVAQHPVANSSQFSYRDGSLSTGKLQRKMLLNIKHAPKSKESVGGFKFKCVKPGCRVSGETFPSRKELFAHQKAVQ